MATHTLVSYGYYDTSFHRFFPGQTRCWSAANTESEVALPPDRFNGGIRFGYMQRRDGFVFVQVDDLVLRAPVLFIGVRHGAKAPGPQWSNLDDDVASRIIADVMVANPELRDTLTSMLRRLPISA